MSTSRASSSTARRRDNNGGGENWVKLRKCNCEELQYFDVKVSGSRNNPRRPYYKCYGCGSFEWVKEEEMLNSDRVEVHRWSVIEEDVGHLKSTVVGLVERSKIITKMVVLLYLVLLICVMFK